MEAGETVILPGGRDAWFAAARELWSRRELFAAFVVRDLRVRYKQTAVGVLWVLLQPLAAGGLLAFVVARLRGDSPDRPLEFWLFFLAALVPWNAFSLATYQATTSLENAATLVGKVYFPRLILPAAAVTGPLTDGLIATGALALIGLSAGAHVALWLVFVPLLFVLVGVTALGVGSGLSSLNAEYRDVKYAVPFALQVGMFLTVLLRLDDWPEFLRPFVGLNPIAAAAEIARRLLAGQPFPGWLFLEAALAATAIASVGLSIFYARERRFADVL